VGSFAVQIAKTYGAEVTGVCSTKNLDLVRELGADHVVDYTKEDFTQCRDHYDLIFDVAAKRSFLECERALRLNGKYVTTEFSPVLAVVGFLRSILGRRKMVPLQPKPPTRADTAFLGELLEARQIKPAIDKCYALSELPSALRHLEGGHTKGKIVIAI
jgi:NADPH:quinone reductase-like Zn-dependent oxidoreductase